MLVLLSILIFVHTFGRAIYLVGGLEPSPDLEFIYNAAFVCGVVWWLKGDARNSAVKHIYCLGVLVGAGWPVIIPYHLIKTRGVRGLIPLAMLMGSFLFAYFAAIIVYVILSTAQ